MLKKLSSLGAAATIALGMSATAPKPAEAHIHWLPIIAIGLSSMAFGASAANAGWLGPQHGKRYASTGTPRYATDSSMPRYEPWVGAGVRKVVRHRAPQTEKQAQN